MTRLIPEAKGTTVNQRLERVSGTQHTYILRVPFRSEKGVLRKRISRFDVRPYLERFSEVSNISNNKNWMVLVELPNFITSPN